VVRLAAALALGAAPLCVCIYAVNKKKEPVA
jgi:hypothetical protein